MCTSVCGRKRSRGDKVGGESGQEERGQIEEKIEEEIEEEKAEDRAGKGRVRRDKEMRY